MGNARWSIKLVSAVMFPTIKTIRLQKLSRKKTQENKKLQIKQITKATNDLFEWNTVIIKILFKHWK